MSETVEISLSKLLDLTGTLSNVLVADLQPLIKNESRLLILEIIRKTPPLRNKSEDGTYDSATAKEAGDKAVEKDLKRLFQSVSDDFISEVGSEAGTSNINIWRTLKNGQRINIQWGTLDYSGGGMTQFHRQNRNSQGRTTGERPSFSPTNHLWKARYVVTQETFAAYLKRRQDNVGRMRAGWIVAVLACDPSLSVPKWLRHANPPGWVQADFTSSNPSITLANNAPGISMIERAIRRAVVTREFSVKSKISKLLNAYAEDVEEGKRLTKHFSVEN